jgi:hypothetical protein
MHALGGIRTHNLNKRAAANLHLRPRGHWDRLYMYIDLHIKNPISLSDFNPYPANVEYRVT